MRISGPLSAVGCPLSVCSLPAFHRHPERSEGSRDKTLVSFSLVTASWREDGIGKTGRRWRGRLCRRVVFAGAQGADGEIVFLNAGGFRRLRRPGSSRHRADALDGSGSAHRAGWFKGSYKYCLSAEPPLAAGATTFPPIQGALWGLSSGVNLSL